MWPSILNPAGERDGRAFGERGGVKVDLEVCQLPADARIERAVVLGLRERQARRGHRTGEQCGEGAAIDDHDCSSLSKACCCYLTPGRGLHQAISINPRHARTSAPVVSFEIQTPLSKL